METQDLIKNDSNKSWGWAVLSWYRSNNLCWTVVDRVYRNKLSRNGWVARSMGGKAQSVFNKGVVRLNLKLMFAKRI